MHLSLRHTLTLFSLALLSLGSPTDILYIQKCLSDYAFIADSGSFTGVPDFSTLGNVFTHNATYDFGGPPGLLRGLADIEASFKVIFPPGTISQNKVTTKSISLSGFDDQGSASEATALSYDTNTFFGQGNLTGQIVTSYARFSDKLVKTNLLGNGGWRITTRVTSRFVRRFSSILPQRMQIHHINDVYVGVMFI